MWNFNVTGFQSIVEYSPRTKFDPKTKKIVTTDKFANELPADYVAADTAKGVRSSHLLVRARIEADLDAMKVYDPNAIVFEDKTADYQFRMIIRREAVAQFNYDQTMGVDYWSHVKEEMNRRSPKADGRMSAYYSVWTALSRIQPNPPYGAPKWSSPVKPTKATTKDRSSKFVWDDGDLVVSKGPKAQSPATGAQTPSLPDAWDYLAGSGASCDDLFSDGYGRMEDWELDLAAGRISRKTMVGQVKEFLAGHNETGDVEDITDRLEASYGTIDLDTLNAVALYDAIDMSATSARTEPVSRYFRRHPNGQMVEVSGYKRSKASASH